MPTVTCAVVCVSPYVIVPSFDTCELEVDTILIFVLLLGFSLPNRALLMMDIIFVSELFIDSDDSFFDIKFLVLLTACLSRATYLDVT